MTVSCLTKAQRIGRIELRKLLKTDRLYLPIEQKYMNSSYCGCDDSFILEIKSSKGIKTESVEIGICKNCAK